MRHRHLKTLIVDDDERSHVALRKILDQRHPELEVVGSGFNVKEGLELIGEHRPDLLFLDIEMPDGTGFDLLSVIPQPSFHLIFITGFNQYAQTAIRFGALDYLTKPISPSELSNAILKVRLRQVEQIQLAQMQIMRETLDRLEKKQLPERMSISTSKGVLFFPTADIIRLEAMENFTEFVVENDARRLIVAHVLKRFEEDLRPYPTFMRVHRSYVVNLLKVVRLIRGDGMSLELTDGKILPVGRKYRDDLNDRLNDLL